MAIVKRFDARLCNAHKGRWKQQEEQQSARNCDEDRDRDQNDNENDNEMSVSPSMLLQSLPKDVLINDVMGFLTDKAVKTFLDSLGPHKLKADFPELGRRFCGKHGSRLEDPVGFRDARHADQKARARASSSSQSSQPQPRCPECHAEQSGTKRCHGCLVFYPRFRADENDPTQAGPGLWCQRCDRMAFCNACLSDDSEGCGSIPSPTAVVGSLSAFEFVCDDCGDEHHRLLRKNKNDPEVSSSASDSNSNSNHHSNSNDDTTTEIEMAIQTCDECGKATCLDPNCLVCADFRLIHMSCSFVPEDAYRLWGRKTCRAESSTKLRRAVSDAVVWVAVVAALLEMWWFGRQHGIAGE
eukprot:jgi/Psemu1/328527/estExt_fgenesh1_pg.C_15260003